MVWQSETTNCNNPPRFLLMISTFLQAEGTPYSFNRTLTPGHIFLFLNYSLAKKSEFHEVPRLHSSAWRMNTNTDERSSLERIYGVP